MSYYNPYGQSPKKNHWVEAIALAAVLGALCLLFAFLFLGGEPSPRYRTRELPDSYPTMRREAPTYEPAPQPQPTAQPMFGRPR